METTSQMEIVSGFSAWEALRGEWNALLAGCPAATPFQTPEWLLPWWQSFGSGEMLVCVFRHRGALTGLAPLFCLRWQGRNQISFIGSGLSDTLDALFAPGAAEAGLHTLLTELANKRPAWDVCDLQDLPSSSPLRAHSALRLMRHAWTEDTPCTRLPLPSDFSAFRAGLSANLRRNLTRYARKLEARGALEWNLVRDATSGRAALRELLSLHAGRWAAKKDDSLASFAGRNGEFLEAAAAGFAAAGLIRLYELRLNGRMIAGILAFERGARLYGYLTSFDSEFEAFSPGALLLGFALENAIREGIEAWDFLRGLEPYKLRFGALRVPKYRLRIEAS